MKVDIVTLAAEKAGSVELPETVFGLTPRADILHRMIVWQGAKRRQGTHKVKNRSEIAGSRRKIQRQKGAGRARHGDRKVNLMRGGGRAFGPTPRSHAIGLPKKIRRLALKHILSAKYRDNHLIILDKAELKAIKTKDAAQCLERLGVGGDVMIIDGDRVDRNFALSVGNLPGVDLGPVAAANVAAIMRRRALILTRSALDLLSERLA